MPRSSLGILVGFEMIVKRSLLGVPALFSSISELSAANMPGCITT
jgi:hypothetical protein